MHNLLPLMVFIGFGTYLSAIDLRVHRLPNSVVGWFTVVQGSVLILLSAGNLKQLSEVIIVASATTGSYMLLFVLSRGSLGMGDVKFAFPIGLTVGWYSADYWLAAIFASFFLAGLVAFIGLVTKRMTRKSRIAFGPYMLLGTFLVCCLGILPR